MSFFAGVDVEDCTQLDMCHLLNFYMAACLTTWDKYLPGVKEVLKDDSLFINMEAILSKIEK